MNLLPFYQKKRVKLLLFYQNIIFSGFLLIIFVLILTIILGGFSFFLDLNYQAVEKEIIVEQSRVVRTETVEGIEKKVKDLNKELSRFKNIQKEQSDIYQVLEKIYQEVLSNRVQVHSLEIDRETKKVLVVGFSLTREDLLEIKEILETSQEYKDIDFPLSNLVSPKDINFRFSFSYEY